MNPEQLRALMTAEALTSSEVAQVVRRKPQTVRAWMCGQRRMPEERAQLLDEWVRRRARRRGQEAGVAA